MQLPCTFKMLKVFMMIVVAMYGAFMLVMYFRANDNNNRDGRIYFRNNNNNNNNNNYNNPSYLPFGVRVQQSRDYSFSESHQLFRMVNGNFKINTFTDVTVMIKTMDRPACLKKLINDIHSQFPNLTILIADDGENASLSRDNGDYIKYFRMPPDSGLSAGRNLMLSQVKTPYFLLLDDDFLWDISILNNFIYVMEIHPYLDVVGGHTGLHYSGFMHIHNHTLYLLQGNHGVLEATEVFQGKPCVVVDFVPNFFFARTESIMNVLWHNILKVGEHEEFFMRLHKGGYNIAFCPDISVANQQSKCSEVQAIEDRQANNRERSRVFIKEGLHIHGLSRMVYCLGEGFAAPSWNKVNDLPDYECHEVPLPKDCPDGWTGEKCEKCKTNFYGPQCQPCDCQHGICAPILPSSSSLSSSSSSSSSAYFRCICDIGWIGDKCQNAVVFSGDLIKDTTFSSMNAFNLEATWKPFLDGCESVGDDGLWLINDGQLSCGASFTLHLNQHTAGLIKIEGESMSVGVDQPDNPAYYSLYSILTFNDGQTKDFFISFSPSSDIQHKELLLVPEKPVKTMTVFVVLRNLYGSAFFKNVFAKTQIFSP